MDNRDEKNEVVFSLEKNNKYYYINKLQIKSFNKKNTISFESEYSIISNIINKNEKITIKHNICNHIFETNIKNLEKLSGIPCPRCRKNVNKKEKLYELELLLENEYEIISNYEGFYEPITIKHLKCGTKFLINPKKVKEYKDLKTLCPNIDCKNKNFNFEKFKINLENKNPEFEIINRNQDDSLEILHKKCNHKFMFKQKKLNNLIKLQCPDCKKKQKQKCFEEELKNKFGNEFELVGEFESKSKPTYFRHTKCGIVFKQTPYEFFKENITLCPNKNCGWSNKILFNKMHPESIVSYISSTIPDSYNILDIYKDNSYMLKLEHKICGEVFTANYQNIVRVKGELCPHCNQSTLKGKLQTILNNHYNNEFSIINIEDFSRHNKKVLLRHNKCNNELMVMSQDIISLSIKCFKCKHNPEIKLQVNSIKEGIIEKKRKALEKRLNNEFIIGENYIGNNNYPVDVTHKLCNKTQSITLTNLLKRTEDNRCEHCVKERLNKDFKLKVPDNFLVMSEYCGNESMIKVKNLQCGHMYKMKASYIKRPNRYSCPICKMDKRFKRLQNTIDKLYSSKFTVVNIDENTNKAFVKHDICGHIDKYNIKSLQRGHLSCSKCKEKEKLEEFKKKVQEQGNGEYTVLGEYKGCNKHIQIKHSCGYIHTYTPKGFLYKKIRCPKCSNKLKKTTDIFKAELYELTKGEFLLKSPYINSKTTVKIKHSKCNRTFISNPSYFLKHTKCPKCYSEEIKLSHEEYLKRFKHKHGEESMLLSQYRALSKDVEILHRRCGYRFKENAQKVLRNKSDRLCPICSKDNKLIHENNGNSFKLKLSEKHPSLVMLGSYTGSKVKTDFKHIDCGHVFKNTPTNIIKSKNPCPICRRNNK